MTPALDAVRREELTEEKLEATLRGLDYLIDDVVADAYVRGAEGLSTEVSPQSAKTLHDAIAAAISDTTLALLAYIAELEAGLAEAEEVVAKYWDAIDMMNDGPDDSDVAYAQGQIAEAHQRARPIAERYRATRAALLPKASVREERGRE